jgi:hypothetical protein
LDQGSIGQARAFAKELVASQPALIFTRATLSTAAVQMATNMIRTISVVVSDPVDEPHTGLVVTTNSFLVKHRDHHASSFVGQQVASWYDALHVRTEVLLRHYTSSPPEITPNIDHQLSVSCV